MVRKCAHCVPDPSPRAHKLYLEVQQRHPRKVRIGTTDVHFKTRCQNTTRPPNDGPREEQNGVYGAGRAYGNNVEGGICYGKRRDCDKE